ncbi:endo alpha-1,4 polygalactosaminidase [Nocardiopsis quinghaiensis]|uniref:endo alpha-1,4 polygalactosaminidase n=1 Tax=Nocardiopsis quinghaiensis TaxID=464995 RepID=UPI001239F4C6|nr:endo alpha-1,4 polygalactosaminidase [Nocardiopsis quinghaiensis]
MAVLAAALCAGCASAALPAPEPPPDGPFDYQLGGGYAPAPDVATVVRDSTGDPVAGLYSVCYVNGFQTQPQDRDRWLSEHPGLVLRDADGDPVADPGWPDEMLLDTSSADTREEIVRVVGEAVATCAERGFDAVEFDNLDSFDRSGGALTAEDNLALAAELVAAAHDRGLAAAQKNAAEITGRAREETGFDFAVAEECVAFDECGAYTDAYGEGVLAVEYPDTLGSALAEVCGAPGTPPRTILRDRDLLIPGEAGHLRESC